MSEVAEKYTDGKRIGALYEAVKNLMETMKWTVEQAMKISEVNKKLLVPRL